MHDKTCIGYVRGEIAKTWQVPARFQKLLCGARVIPHSENHIPVSQYMQAGNALLDLSMIVSLEDAFQNLDNCERKKGEKTALLKDIVGLGPRGGQAAIEAVGTALAHPHAYVREAAVEAVLHIAARGNHHVVDLIVAEMTREPLVAEAALEVIAMLAERGYPGAVNAVVARVKSANNQIRMCALRVVGCVAKQGDMIAIAAVKEQLKSAYYAFWMAAVNAIGQLMGQGDAIDEVISRIQHERDDVSLEAMRVVSKHFRGQPVKRMVDAFFVRLLSTERGFRQAVVDTLAQLAEKGTQQDVLSAAHARLEHEDSRTRDVVVNLIGRLAKSRDVVLSASRLVNDEEPEVREAALNALAQSAAIGEQVVSDAILPRLADESAWVREAALHAVN